MPERIQLSRKKGWRLPENAVKVDRSTKWGNPFRVGVGLHETSPEIAVGSFRQLLTAAGSWSPVPVDKWPIGKIPAQFTTVDEVKTELRGKDLACWCKPGHWCHADVLLEIANS